MSDAVYLTMRFGGGITNPSDNEMKVAIQEVFHEDQPHLNENYCVEHPNSWLSFGFESGDKWTNYDLDLYRGGNLIFSKYDDQDDAEPVFGYSKQVTEQEALRLWRLLASGNTKSLLKEDWT